MTELVARLKPTVTRIVTGELVDGEIHVDPFALTGLRPYEFGVPRIGWLTVGEGVLREDVLAFPVLRTEALPRHLIFSEYDIGHEVVVVAGEFMGATGGVRDIQALQTLALPPRVSYVLHGGAAHVQQALGVLWDGGSPEDLAPLSLRLPAGSSAWAWTNRWERAIVTGYDLTQAQAYLVDAENQWAERRCRLHLLPRHDNVAPPPPVDRPRPSRRRNVPASRKLPR